MAIKIFIDQGHNPQGANAGAEGNGLREQDITYNVGRHLYELLSSNPSFEAKLSRTTKTEKLGTTNVTSLKARVDMANEWGANYFISIHTNASDNPSANGTEGYVYRLDTPAYYLSKDIVDAIANRMGTKNRGVMARPTLYVLRKSSMPSTLIELAYITNSDDAEKMSEDPNGFASAMYQGILMYFGMLE